MKEEYVELLRKSKLKVKENAVFIKRFRKKSKKDIDRGFQLEHDKVFEKVDCLECANCCKTTSPIFTNQDIKRLSKLFKMKQPQFVSEYLRIDEDNDYVLKMAPCPFLNEDNTCFVYDVRPSACREYPHTDRKNMYQILDLVEKNALVCPAVATIVENLKIAAKKNEPSHLQ